MAGRALASHNGPPAKASPGASSASLYIKNLPDKLAKQDLRTALYTLFSTYGAVLDVVAIKTAKMRGQAHVVFRDAQTSTQAMRALQDFEFFGKEMKITYAKGRSNVFTRLEGVYRAPTAETASLSTATELQKAIFNMASTLQGAPGMGSSGLVAGSVSGVLPAAATAAAAAAVPAVNGSKADEGPQGVKRRRDDDDESGEETKETGGEKDGEKSDEDASMEEDDDVSMAASSDSEE